MVENHAHERNKKMSLKMKKKMKKKKKMSLKISIINSARRFWAPAVFSCFFFATSSRALGTQSLTESEPHKFHLGFIRIDGKGNISAAPPDVSLNDSFFEIIPDSHLQQLLTLNSSGDDWSKNAFEISKTISKIMHIANLEAVLVSGTPRRFITFSPNGKAKIIKTNLPLKIANAQEFREWLIHTVGIHGTVVSINKDNIKLLLTEGSCPPHSQGLLRFGKIGTISGDAQKETPLGVFECKALDGKLTDAHLILSSAKGKVEPGTPVFVP